MEDKDDNEMKFSPTDVIPLVNKAWEKSFARKDCAMRAIIQRGWNPLNYVLLDHPKLIRMEKPSFELESDDESEYDGVGTNTNDVDDDGVGTNTNDVDDDGVDNNNNTNDSDATISDTDE